MYKFECYRCCKKCEKMKQKYLEQKRINEELLQLVSNLNDTQVEIKKYITLITEKKSKQL